MALPTARSSSGTTKITTFEYSWTIENIGGLYDGTAVGCPELHSPTFVAPPEITTANKKPVEFRLRFGSIRHNPGAHVYISLRKMHFACSSLDILYTLSVVKANGEKCVVGTPNSRLDGQGEKFGFQMFRDELFNSADGFVSNDSLTIHCVVHILMAKSGNSDLYGQLQHKYSHFAKSFGDLLESGIHSDVTFVDSDGQEHRAHKIILAARSQVFADMFEFATEDTNPIMIDESRDVFKQALLFIYTGDVGTSLNGIAKDLLICADKYQLDQLKSMCEEYLVGSITAESDLMELFQLTRCINVPNLKLKVVELMRNDFDFDSHIMTLVQKRPLTGQATNSKANKKSKSKKS